MIRMKKEKFTIEYPLYNSSETYLWKMIGDPLGLALWFSDGVTVDRNEYTFSWDDHSQTAFLLEIKEGKYIRFQWEEDKGTDYYFELKIVALEVTGDLALIIIDFAEPGDKEDSIMLWNKQIETLRRKTGM